MKVYAFGEKDRPALVLLPGTCCHWKGNFGHVIPALARDYRVLAVSYDGFDETEATEFPTMLEETAKIEDYLLAHCGGHIRGAYGCSLGGSFVGLLAVRGRVRMDHGILGGSDLDQASPLLAKLETKLMMPLFYPLVRDGQFSARFLQKQMEKSRRAMPEYLDAFLGMFGGARPYVTRRSCENQFYSDLVTPLPEGISVPGTTIHVFYAEKMGKKYLARYRKHFKDPVIYSQDLQHEELLACHPEGWARLVKSILGAPAGTGEE
ncbi:MAG: alpha/beta fold hydrolase [Dysosmobacter sp.]|nr:alpha/beta fold hydrolase [Dysosmobacter sp.]